MLIGITGLIGAGKDTIANHLVENHGYERYSWATPLKDISATLFGWDRDMLEGSTTEQRAQRELVDEWWSQKLGVKWSPRIALQLMGTEVMRNGLHPDIWVLAGMHRIAGKENIVISDMRFPNEIKAVRDMGGVIWNVRRGQLPHWYLDLANWRWANENVAGASVDQYMMNKWPGIHASEYSWVGTQFDHVFGNDGSITDLTEQVDSVIGN